MRSVRASFAKTKLLVGLQCSGAIWALAVIVLVSQTRADEKSFYRGEAYARPTLSYAEIDGLLQAHPPRELNGYRPNGQHNDPQRNRAADALNAHIYWEGPLSDDLASF